MDRETIIETIQRLLALSGSPNEHEAKLALARAQEWMIRHNVSMAEVEAGEVHRDSYGEEVIGKRTARTPWEDKFLVQIIREFFFVRPFTRTVTDWDGKCRVLLVFFGDRENVAVARHVYVYLARTFRRLWLEYKAAEGLRQREAQAFYLGLSAGFSDKLRAERRVETERNGDTSRALVVIETALDRRFREKYKKMRTSRARMGILNAGTLKTGYERGWRISLHQPVGDSSTRQAIGRE